MEFVNVTIIAPDGSEYEAEVDMDANANVLLRDLTKALGLPSETSQGDPVDHRLEIVGGLRLEEGGVIRIREVKLPAVRIIRRRS